MIGSPAYPWEAPLGAVPLPAGRRRASASGRRAPASSRSRSRGGAHPLEPEGYGVYAAELPAGAGRDYAYVVDGERLPDPCSPLAARRACAARRASLDPAAFAWTDDGWQPAAAARRVLYELHVGTFTEEGTFDGGDPAPARACASSASPRSS